MDPIFIHFPLGSYPSDDEDASTYQEPVFEKLKTLRCQASSRLSLVSALLTLSTWSTSFCHIYVDSSLMLLRQLAGRLDLLSTASKKQSRHHKQLTNACSSAHAKRKTPLGTNVTCTCLTLAGTCFFAREKEVVRVFTSTTGQTQHIGSWNFWGKNIAGLDASSKFSATRLTAFSVRLVLAKSPQKESRLYTHQSKWLPRQCWVSAKWQKWHLKCLRAHFLPCLHGNMLHQEQAIWPKYLQSEAWLHTGLQHLKQMAKVRSFGTTLARWR